MENKNPPSKPPIQSFPQDFDANINPAKKNNFTNLLILVVVFIIVCGSMLAGNYIGRQQLPVQQPGTAQPPPSPTYLPYKPIKHKPVKVSNIDDFFDPDKFVSRATTYLVDNSLLDLHEKQEIVCTKTYSSNYVDFEKKQLYLDFSNLHTIKDLNTIMANSEKYKLKDEILAAFISNPNNLPRQRNPNQRISDIAKCTTKDNETIIAYTLNLADTPETTDTALWLGYLGSDNSLTHTITIPKQDGLSGCLNTPFVFTSNQIGYFECGYIDAGAKVVSIYQVDYVNQTTTEILNCLSYQESGIDSTIPEKTCRIPDSQISP